jgi:hypothetical protein
MQHSTRTEEDEASIPTELVNTHWNDANTKKDMWHFSGKAVAAADDDAGTA